MKTRMKVTLVVLAALPVMAVAEHQPKLDTFGFYAEPGNADVRELPVVRKKAVS